MQHCIKVLFNVCENMNEHVLKLLEEINKSYVVTDSELDVSFNDRLMIIIDYRKNANRGSEKHAS